MKDFHLLFLKVSQILKKTLSDFLNYSIFFFKFLEKNKKKSIEKISMIFFFIKIYKTIF